MKSWRNFKVTSPVDNIDNIDKKEHGKEGGIDLVDKVDLVDRVDTIDSDTEPPDCFDPHAVLEKVIREAQGRGWTDERLTALVDELIQNGCLQAPWGFKVKGSPIAGDYWILSDTAARARIPAGASFFTRDELRPMVEACRILKGKVFEVKKARGGKVDERGI